MGTTAAPGDGNGDTQRSLDSKSKSSSSTAVIIPVVVVCAVLALVAAAFVYYRRRAGAKDTAFGMPGGDISIPADGKGGAYSNPMFDDHDGYDQAAFDHGDGSYADAGGSGLRVVTNDTYQSFADVDSGYADVPADMEDGYLDTDGFADEEGYMDTDGVGDEYNDGHEPGYLEMDGADDGYDHALQLEDDASGDEDYNGDGYLSVNADGDVDL